MPSQSVPFASGEHNPEYPNILDVDPKEVWEKKSQVVIVDVRQPNEYTGELGHIPGSQLMVLDTLPQVSTDLPKNATLVMVCRSGNRSSRAAAFLKENGFTQVYNMRGGMILWNKLGLTVEGKSDS